MQQDDTLDTSLLVHGVVDPGEWDPSQPIQFGSADDEPADTVMNGDDDEVSTLSISLAGQTSRSVYRV